ncbi:MAG: NAD(P)/FAD-dependent oxidoreductase [Chloroflexi bacterium]|nr:NAD(P)/FAD-dependent oxidoreductase [Chloroflexota bacterium]
MRYVIIGNSYTAVGAVESIRELDRQGEIIIISDEPYATYCRPLITYWITGSVDAEKLALRPANWYEDHRVTTRLGQKVVNIVPESRHVVLEDGETVAFDRLLIATGGKPFMPPIEGIDAEGVFAMAKLDDAKEFNAWVSQEHVEAGVIVGAGLICLSLFKAMEGMNIKFTLVELLDRVLGIALDHTASGMIEKRLLAAGVGVRTSSLAEAILQDEQGRVRAIRLKGGDEIPCQAVVMAVGMRPNVDLLEGSGVEVNRGIVVDDGMRTNVPGVYAAGDVVETWDIVNEMSHVIAILPLAYEQGRIAGWNMAGAERRYPGGIPLNSLPIFDTSLMTMGITITDDRPDLEVLTHQEADQVYRKLVFREDRLVGAILVGDIAHGGVLTALIRSQAPVTYDRQAMLKGDPLDIEVTRQREAARKNVLWERTPGPALAVR